MSAKDVLDFEFKGYSQFSCLSKVGMEVVYSAVNSDNQQQFPVFKATLKDLLKARSLYLKDLLLRQYLKLCHLPPSLHDSDLYRSGAPFKSLSPLVSHIFWKLKRTA